MAAGEVTIDDDGTENKTGLAGDIYDQRVLSLAEVEPPGQVPAGAPGVPLKRGLALDANALANAITAGNGGSLPAGAVIQWAGSAAPTGFLLCDGSAVSRETYLDLFTAISTTFGIGDGSTTFNLPDLRARVPMGVNAVTLPNGVNGSYSTRALAATGGAETHTLSTGEMPNHAHSSTELVYETPGVGTLAIPLGLGFDVGGATDDLGGGGAHANVQPFLVLHYIVKT
jgi:microcystin-dependent protein